MNVNQDKVAPMSVNEFLDAVMPTIEDPLAKLKQEIHEILVDEDGHYRTELSGADVIEQLTIVAEQHHCLTLCPRCDGNGCPDDECPDDEEGEGA